MVIVTNHKLRSSFFTEWGGCL